MSAFKGTVQDWKRSGTTIYALNTEGSNRFSANVQGGWAIDGWRRTDEDELLANARLIAAAPELLDALQRLNSATRRYMEERPESDAEWASDEPSVLSIVDAAIAKATGGAA